jgi:hypothetical protein
MKLASTSEKLQRIMDAIPGKAGRFPVLIQPLERLRVGPNTAAEGSRDADLKRWANWAPGGHAGRDRRQRPIYEACKVVPALKPGVRTGETRSSARRSLVEEVLA